jgi:putative ABC transport system permease protein
VTPAQAAALHPTTAQVLYRWTGGNLDTQAGLDAHLAAATAALPTGAVAGSRSYLTLKTAAASGPGRYLPFLAIFGALGLAVAILIVANVVSGAVVSGYRHIGVLKSLGFTPRQVVSVYLLMAGVPALAGALPGAALGYPLAAGLLDDAFTGAGLGTVTVAAWPVMVAVLGMLAIVLLAAAVPAVRAGRLSAARATSAGSAPRPGRALRTQRRLTGSRLPRAVSLGLGLPLTRPGRTALTASAVVLGVTTVAFASGVAASLGRFADARDNSESVQVIVLPELGPDAEKQPAVAPAATEAKLAGLPGTAGVTALSEMTLATAGYDTPARMQLFHGNYAALGYQDQLVSGRWLAGPGETVVTSAFFRDRDVALGDRVTLLRDGARTEMTVVGEVMGDDPDEAYADWATYLRLAPGAPLGGDLVQYLVRLKPGTDATAYLDKVRAADAGLFPVLNDEQANSFVVTVDSIAVVLTVMLSTVAALGVFQTVVLNTRERRRDLGMLKSIGMTPRQVVTMMVTSMAGLGVLGGVLGLLLGVVAHRVSVPLVAAAAGTDIPATMLAVWRWPLAVAMLLAGVAIAVLGALLPARAAGRLPVAEALHNE